MDAADATPVSLCAIGEGNIPAAEKQLPKNLCPLIKASYGGAVTDRCPFFIFLFDIEKKIAALEKRTAELKEKYEREYKGKPSRPRILITGCPTHGVIDKVIKRIEELGADVVGFENCCGPREKKAPVDEKKDPVTRLPLSQIQ